MANTKSAQKRNRQAQKRRARNVIVRNSLKSVLKDARTAITSGDAGKAKDLVTKATAALDTAASKGVLHARNAQRRISRLALGLNKLATAKK